MKYKKESKKGVSLRYDAAFKWMVISEYKSGRWTMEQLRRRYGLGGKSCISEWIARMDHGGRAKDAEVWASDTSTMAKPKRKERPEDLRKQLKELERQLEDEQLKSEAYSLLIDLAEREHRIDIRKKDNTK